LAPGYTLVSGQVLSSTPTSAVSVRLQFAVTFFSFAGVFLGVVQSTQDYFPRRWVERCTWCVMLTCSFCIFTQATLELAGKEQWPASFSVAQHREVFHGLRAQDVAEFDFD
jgi:hypothetical protein